jgi:NTE family protein
MEKNHKKTVSLVLGSGGARGLVHIGVIQWLEAHHYTIASISGCSIGALIGGVHAAGKLPKLEEWMRSISNIDIVNQLDFSWSRNGIFKGEKIINTLVDLLEDVQIEDLDIPFTAVAADIVSGREVWLNKGSLFDAIRASISLPLFFEPVHQDDRVLIDGGVLNPVPIAPTLNDNTDLIIAVDLGADPINANETKELKEPEEASAIELGLKKIVETLGWKDEEPKRSNLGMYNVAIKAFDAMQSTIARQKSAAYPPDIEILFARDLCGTFEFDRADELIQLGYDRAAEIMKNSKN